MEREIMGTVVSVKRQWWLKINTKPFRKNALDGAIFPHVIKVKYTVDGVEYTRKKWVNAGVACPAVGATVSVIYQEKKPKSFRWRF